MGRKNKITNFEKIHSMSIEEFVEFLDDLDKAVYPCRERISKGRCMKYGKKEKKYYCKQCIYEWLQEETEIGE